MVNAIGVFLAGGAGCLTRYLLGLCIPTIMTIPVATLLVNVLGGFLAGIIISRVPSLKIILLTGFLGGFTTFSAFSLECLHFIQNGQIVTAMSYIIASILLSITAAWCGCLLFT